MRKLRMDDLERQLLKFAEAEKFDGKGALCLALAVTRAARNSGMPLRESDFLTAKEGQVKGLGRSAIQAILKDYNVHRVLAKEGGRTSRGNMGRMKRYVQFLNGLPQLSEEDLQTIEAWWVHRVRLYFALDPLKLHLDPSKSLETLFDDLLAAAKKRQDSSHGVMVVGAVMQHLVGAKLEIALPNVKIAHSGFCVADEPTGRAGDFQIGNTVIHVTTSSSPLLLQKCKQNLDASLRPLVITLQSERKAVGIHSNDIGIAQRIDVLEIGQFLCTNVFEWSKFEQEERSDSLRKLIEHYNRIVESHETDPSLRISIA